MLDQSNKKKLEQVKLLLAQGMIQAYPGGLEAPVSKATLFWGGIPAKLLSAREEAIEHGERFREWILVTDEDLDSEWREALRSEYAVDVIRVDDLSATRAALLRDEEETPHLMALWSEDDKESQTDVTVLFENAQLFVELEPRVRPDLQTDETALAQAMFF